MPLLAPRIERVRPSASTVAAQLARDLRRAGRDIIDLGIGEPDFDTPPHVIEATTAAMRRGETRYTTVDGTPELKEAVAGKFARENRLHYTTDQITVGAGAKQIIYNAMMATIAPGDEVIVPAPYWVSYTEIVRLAEGTPVEVQAPQNNGFKLRPEDLEAAITPRTKWLVLNTPCNPTGATYTKAELAALAEVLVRHAQVHVMTDDIYEHILFDRRPFHTMAEAAPELFDRTLTINGVSKAYAMTGWRIGYAGGPRPLIGAIRTLLGQSTSNASSVSQAAALAALTGPQEQVAERCAIFEKRRDVAAPIIDAIPGLACHLPEGAFYLYPNCAGLIGRRRPDGKVIQTDEASVAVPIGTGGRLDRARRSIRGIATYQTVDRHLAQHTAGRLPTHRPSVCSAVVRNSSRD